MRPPPPSPCLLGVGQAGVVLGLLDLGVPFVHTLPQALVQLAVQAGRAYSKLGCQVCLALRMTMMMMMVMMMMMMMTMMVWVLYGVDAWEPARSPC